MDNTANKRMLKILEIKLKLSRFRCFPLAPQKNLKFELGPRWISADAIAYSDPRSSTSLKAKLSRFRC